MNNTYIPITEARKNLFEISQQAGKPGRVFRITQNGVPTVALISSGDLDALYETLDILSTHSGLARELATARRELKSGDVVEWNSIKHTYGIQDRPQKNSTKRARKNTKKV